MRLSEAAEIISFAAFLKSQEENVFKDPRFLHFCLGVCKKYFISEQIWRGLMSVSGCACVVSCAHRSGTGCGRWGWGFQVVDQVGEVGYIAV